MNAITTESVPVSLARFASQTFFSLLLLTQARAGEIRATVQDDGGKPVADAVVFLYEAKAGPPPTAVAEMDQVDKEFVPHVLPVAVGTRVKFPNKDNIHHHVYSFSKTKKFELPLYKDEPTEPVTMDKTGVIKLGCNIHDWMLGYILVLDNPYFAKTGADGQAVIKAPAGSYKLAVWSERLKGSVDTTLQPVKVAEKLVKALFKPPLVNFRKPKRPAVSGY